MFEQAYTDMNWQTEHVKEMVIELKLSKLGVYSFGSNKLAWIWTPSLFNVQSSLNRQENDRVQTLTRNR